ncbi:MAG: hypothetical protein ORN28_01190, partial [Rhodoferax sp.]|nr:hypothetical protein [Rhodoferax sp.]
MKRLLGIFAIAFAASGLFAQTGPTGPTLPASGNATLSVTTTAATTQLPVPASVGPTINLINTGSYDAFCTFGSGASIAVTPTNYQIRIEAGRAKALAATSAGGITYSAVACVTSSNATTVNLQQSIGVIPVAVLGGSGGGGGGLSAVTASAPLASSGGNTPNISFQPQAAKTFNAGPSSGAAATPIFRAIANSDLPVATASAVGAVKPGTGLSIADDGTLNASGGGGSTVSVNGATVANPNFANNSSQTNAVNFSASGSTVSAQLSDQTNVVAASVSLTDTTAAANSVTLDAPTTLSSSYTVTFPASPCNSGQIWAFINNTGTLNCVVGASGTVTSVNGSGGTTGLTISGVPITGSGTFILGGILGVANGGTGTGTPGLVAGSNVTITGTWPNQTISATAGGAGVSSVTFNGGTAQTGAVSITQAQPDWNASSGVTQILNKPTIPAAPVNSDWNATTGLAQILNKPTIPVPPTTAQITAIADQEIATYVGSGVGGSRVNSATDTATVAVIVNSNQVTVTNAQGNAAALVSILTGVASPVVNTPYAALPAYSRLGANTQASTGTIPVSTYVIGGASGFQVTATSTATAAQVSAIFAPGGTAVSSGTVYAGPATFGTFAFQPAPAAAIQALAPITGLTTSGFIGPATLTNGVLNIPPYLRSNVTSNLFAGSQAGVNISTGIYDTGFGAFACNSVTTGTYNTCVGNAAIWLLTTGNFNTALGALALSNLLTGSKNACLGYDCLRTNTSASNVVSIGGWNGDNQSNRVVASDGDGQIVWYSKTPIAGGDQTRFTLLNGRTTQGSGGALEVPGSVVFQPPTTTPTLGVNLDAAIWMNGAVPTLTRRDSTGTTTDYPLGGGGTGGGPAGTTSVSWIQSNSGTSSPYVINPGTVSASAVVPVSIQASTNLATSNAGSGLIAGTRYIGTQQTIQPTYNSAVQFPTSLASGGYFTDFRASVTTVVIRATMSNATVPNGAVVYFGFGKASAIAASADPLNDANVLPWFDSVGNDPNPFQTIVKPTVTIAAVSGQANTYDFTVSGGVWFGGGNAPAYTGSTTDWLPYITLTPTNSATTVVLSSVSSAATTGFNAVTTLGLQGASGGGGTVPTMQAANNAGNTISNANSGTSTTTWSNTVSNDATVIQPGIVTARSLQVGPTGSANRITQQAPSILPSSYTLVLPSGVPTANQYMGASNITSGTVTMAWQTPGGSSSSLCVFSVGETSPGTGATLFAVGTRGGTVTNTVTGCGVTA